MPDWLALDSPFVQWLAIVSPILFVGTLLIVPELVVRMRADYFLTEEGTREATAGPARIVGRILKNLLGLALLVVGVAMLVLPGQGLLTILVALALLNFPGKRRFELALVRRPLILRTVNALRRRRERPPLELPQNDGAPGDSER